MNRILALCVVLAFMVSGCGEEEKQKVASAQKADPIKQASVVQNSLVPIRSQTVASYGGVEVTVRPETPASGDCLEATVKGLSGATFIWDVNGTNVQQNENSRYCLEDTRRDDVVTVTVGDAARGSTTSITVGNSLPRILDTAFEFVAEGGVYVIEVTPQTEDADADYVELSYQWLINGQVNDEYTENRLPTNAYKTGDKIQVKVTPSDGYGTGPTYVSRNLEMLSAVPVITSQPPKSFEALEYTYQVEADDVDSNELTFYLEDAPDGMTVDAVTGLIVWPLTEISAGEYQIKIVVTDQEGSTDSQEFTLNLEKRRPSKQAQE